MNYTLLCSLFPIPYSLFPKTKTKTKKFCTSRGWEIVYVFKFVFKLHQLGLIMDVGA